MGTAIVFCLWLKGAEERGQGLLKRATVGRGLLKRTAVSHDHDPLLSTTDKSLRQVLWQPLALPQGNARIIEGLHSSAGLSLKWQSRVYFLLAFLFSSIDKLEAYTSSSKGPGRATDIGEPGRKRKHDREQQHFPEVAPWGTMAALHHSALRPLHITGQQGGTDIFKGSNGGKGEDGGTAPTKCCPQPILSTSDIKGEQLSANGSC